jgi:large subunit ribosomal protein L19
MTANVIEKILQEKYQNIKPPSFSIGDTVRVHARFKEGDKERVQAFTGTVIAIKGQGLNKSFTVRRVSYGVGVEKIFPLYSPHIVQIDVLAHSKVRRAKLYYMREFSGKKARVKGDSSS